MTIMYMVSPNPVVMSEIKKYMKGTKTHTLILKGGEEVMGVVEVGNDAYNDLMNTKASLEIQVYTQSYGELPIESTIHHRCIPAWLPAELFENVGFKVCVRK